MSSDPTLGDPTDQEPHTWLGGGREETGQAGSLPGCAMVSGIPLPAWCSSPGNEVLPTLFLVLSGQLLDLQ